MSLLDDYIESSEAAHGTSTIQFGADTLTAVNAFDAQDDMRVNAYSETHTNNNEKYS
jgi:hypothetical protein